MTQSEMHSADSATDRATSAAKQPGTTFEDVGSRAAERFADLYAETEHERRASSFDRAISKAREE